MNVATVLVATFDQDFAEKLAWARPLADNYGHHVYIVGRVKEAWLAPDLLPPGYCKSLSLVCMHASPNLDLNYDSSKQRELESWLGVSFKYLSSLDWRFFDRTNCKDARRYKDVYNYLAALTDYFRDFLVSENIETVVVGLEILPWSLIFYYTAKRLGIPIITMVSSRFPRQGVMLCKEDYADLWEWNGSEGSQWQEMLSLYSNKVRGDRRQVKLLRYWRPKIMVDIPRRMHRYTSIRSSMIRICTHERCAIPPLRIDIKRVIEASLRRILNTVFYQKMSSNDQFFFFPLHFENDAQLTLREPFANQFKVVTTIARCLPQGVWLYVKPHPHYVATDVRFQDLRKISRLPNVRILNPLVPSIRVIRDSIGVITLNSTTGFEAMILDKPVISLGHDFYCREDLCYLIRDWNELPAAIFKVMQQGKPPSSTEEIRDFVNTVYKNTVFTTGQISEASDNCFTADDGKRIAFALDKVLQRIGSTGG